jgi:hypothetical protein
MSTHKIIIHGKTPFFQIDSLDGMTMINLLNVKTFVHHGFGYTLFLDGVKIETTVSMMPQIMNAIAKCTALGNL